jgi:hypothetical protein
MSHKLYYLKARVQVITHGFSFDNALKTNDLALFLTPMIPKCLCSIREIQGLCCWFSWLDSVGGVVGGG